MAFFTVYCKKLPFERLSRHSPNCINQKSPVLQQIPVQIPV
jgi:hypothetical protein